MGVHGSPWDGSVGPRAVLVLGRPQDGTGRGRVPGGIYIGNVR